MCFISFGFLLATICVWVWMVCSLHSVTTGSRDRANVSLIIIVSVVCVVIPFILDVRLVDAPAGVTHRRKVTHNFSTFLLRCLPQFLSREGFSRPFPSSTVRSHFVYPRINRSPLLLGHDSLFFIYFVRKNPSSCDCTEIRTHAPPSEGFEVIN